MTKLKEATNSDKTRQRIGHPSQCMNDRNAAEEILRAAYHMFAAKSNRRVARDSSHAVEVRILAGKIGDSIRLHDCHDQGVVGEEAILLADTRRAFNHQRWDGED